VPGRQLSPEEVAVKLKAIGWAVIAWTFGLGFTVGNLFALLLH
jgi:hypothetical protein